jgi:beta-lactam-binding protein with PASTA domain
MRGMLVLPVIALTFAVTACGDDDSSSDTSSAATTTVAVPDIVGQTVDEATATLQSAGLTLRVVKRDGEDLAGTADYVTTRVNVAVETQADGTEKVTQVVSVG